MNNTYLKIGGFIAFAIILLAVAVGLAMHLANSHVVSSPVRADQLKIKDINEFPLLLKDAPTITSARMIPRGVCPELCARYSSYKGPNTYQKFDLTEDFLSWDKKPMRARFTGRVREDTSISTDEHGWLNLSSVSHDLSIKVANISTSTTYALDNSFTVIHNKNLDKDIYRLDKENGYTGWYSYMELASEDVCKQEGISSHCGRTDINIGNKVIHASCATSHDIEACDIVMKYLTADLNP